MWISSCQDRSVWADGSARRECALVIPGQRRPVARMTRNWPPPGSMSAVTGSPGTSRENRSTSQSAASWASRLVGQRPTISRPPCAPASRQR